MSLSADASVPHRVPTEYDYHTGVPVHVVWELTLACNLKCQHCGSRAGTRRPAELSTEEALDVVAQLARLGTRELSVIGGEAYLRNDWIEIIRRATDLGMLCSMQTGARALTEARLRAGAEAGLRTVGVSVDGLADLHDELRGVSGTFANAFKVIQRAREIGLGVTVNTQIGPRTIGQLPDLMAELIKARVTHWQIQLTVAMGNAADNDELLLQPYQLADLMPLLARLYREGQQHGLLLIPGNNVGYFGPYEQLWRNYGSMFQHWTGCEAGHTLLGIEADGTVKGCPSLATGTYAGGNIRDMSIEDMWRYSREIAFRRARRESELWGYCQTCYYAEVCDAGCTWTAHSLLGRAGNNPYCHHRVLELAKKGVRERIVKVEAASATPFGVGRFELIEEPAAGHPGRAGQPAPPRRQPATAGDGTLVLSLNDARRQLRKLARDTEPAEPPGQLPEPPRLQLCGDCGYFIKTHEQSCPFCGADVAEAAQRAEDDHNRRVDLMNQVRQLLGNVT